MKTKILCTGTLVVDIFSSNITGVIAPNTGFSTGVEHHPGGNVLNMAVNLSKLAGKSAEIHCCGVTGDDIFSDMLMSYMKKHGIICHVQKMKGKETAKCLIIGFKDKSRAFVGDKGANDFYTAFEIMQQLKKVKPDIFYAGETSSLPLVDMHLGAILKQAKKQGAINVVDYIIAGGRPRKTILHSGRYIDAMHINDREAEMLTGKKKVWDALDVFVEAGIKLPAISSGEKPLVYAWKGRKYREQVFKVKCVDATGAGDSFTAGLIKGLSCLKGSTIGEKLGVEGRAADVIRMAQAAGAAAVTATGCTAGVTLKKVRQILGTVKTNR